MLTVANLPAQALQDLLHTYSILVESVANGEVIPGSFWGDSEAGIIRDTLYVRPETPVHSAVAMNSTRMPVETMTRKMQFVTYKFY